MTHRGTLPSVSDTGVEDAPAPTIDLGGGAEEAAKPVTRSIVDIQAIIDAEIERSEEKLEVVGSIPFMGVDYDLVRPANAFTMMRSANIEEDPAIIAETMLQLIHPDQRVAFIKALGRVPVLPAMALVNILNAMYEVVAERPTQQSTRSARGRTPRRSVKN